MDNFKMQSKVSILFSTFITKDTFKFLKMTPV